MIISFWPIYADHNTFPGNPGGIDGLRHAVEYITNPAKTFSLAPPDLSFFPDDPQLQHMVTSMNADGVTNVHYVSSYLCSADHAAQDFLLNAYILSAKTRFATDPENGPIAYHMVQSFPPNLDISDEEVHQCGIELVKKLEKYQGIIASHVHPVIDAEDHIHGRCKHNHILISAFVHADSYDPAIGGPCKLHDCTETYHQLQIYNDEIAVDHGLPIIHHCDKHRTHSRSGRTEIPAGVSPEDQLRREIEKARSSTASWGEFTQQLLADGYAIKEFGDVTYTTPDGHIVCDRTLGHKYTKNFLELFWTVRDTDAYVCPDKPVLSRLVASHDGPLFVHVPLGPDFLQNRPHKTIPLAADVPGDASALLSYFGLHDLYEVFDESEQVVAIVSGLEICRSIEDLRDTELELLRLRAKEEDELRIKRERAQRERERVRYIDQYYNRKFRDSRNGRPVCCSYYDEDGRARTGLELIYVLALTILGKEAYLWVPRGDIPQDQENEIFFAKTNVKIQRMVNAFETAQREGIESPAQLVRLLDQARTICYNSQETLSHTRRILSSMTPLVSTIAVYELTHKVAAAVAAMPSSPEKAVAQARYATAIQEHESATQILQARGLTDATAIKNFQLYYEQLQNDARELEERISSEGQRLSMLETLQRDLQLAQDPYFLCDSRYLNKGQEQEPEQEQEQEQEQDQEQTTKPGDLLAKIKTAQKAAVQQATEQKKPSINEIELLR